MGEDELEISAEKEEWHHGVTHQLDEAEARLAILRQDLIMHLRKAKELVQRFDRLEADIKALREDKE